MLHYPQLGRGRLFCKASPVGTRQPPLILPRGAVRRDSCPHQFCKQVFEREECGPIAQSVWRNQVDMKGGGLSAPVLLLGGATDSEPAVDLRRPPPSAA